jgi:hypothetical protein
MTAGPPIPKPSAVLPAGSAVPLAYEPAPAQRLTGRQIRWIILLGAALLGFTALLFNPVTIQNESFGYGILGTPLGPLLNSWLGDRAEYLIYSLGYLSLFLFTEWLFLLPRGRLSFQTSDRRRSRRASAIAAAFIGMLLTAGIAASIMELTDVWKDWLAVEGTVRGLPWKGFYGFWIGMAVAWVLWAVVFYAYYRDADHHTAVAKMTRVLLAGTVLELLVSVPAYVHALRDPDNCYCEKGSYTGLVFGCTAVFWLFGPGVYLLLLRERRRWKPKV